MKNKLSISEAISFGWHTFWSNWKFWVVVTLLIGAARIGTGTSFTAPAGRGGQGFLNDFKNEMPMIDQYPVESGISSVESEDYGADVFGVATKRVLGDKDTKANPVLVGIGIVYATVLVVFMILFSLLSILATIVLRMGHINLRLDAARGNEVFYKTLLNQVSFKKAVKVATAQFLAGLITLVGFIFFIVPGIYFMLRFMFASYVIVDEDLKIGESLKRSSQLTKGVKLKLFLFILVVFGMFLLGVIAFGVGTYIVSIVVSLALAHIYMQLADAAPKPAIETAVTEKESRNSENSSEEVKEAN